MSVSHTRHSSRAAPIAAAALAVSIGWPGAAAPVDGLDAFILHHATAPYGAGVGVTGSLARWRGGRPESICPRTVGLEPAYDDFVTARVRALAAEVGAPVQANPDCRDNVQITFTDAPDKIMAQVLKTAARTLGVRYPTQIRRQLEVSGAHAIQGWYLTTAGDGRVLNTDADLLGGPENLLPLWPIVIQTSQSVHGGAFGAGFSGIVGVVLVVDTRRLGDLSIGPIADYLAMLALSVVQSPDHCDPPPSIFDLMTPDCRSRPAPTAVTAADIAFLKALYYHNTGLGPTLSRDDIRSNMQQQLEHP